MIHDMSQRTDSGTESRPIDPNVQQRKASNPAGNCWVAASAGTGKTKVLSDRVLRLLLPRENGGPGSEPHRILCLTFTKAAAGEMAIRISERLSSWAVMGEDDLREDLRRNLLGHLPSEAQVMAARRLFARVLDAPGGLKIMTIHAFCQSVLKRFPLEAGVSPQFDLIEERAQAELLSRAMRNVVAVARSEKGSETGIALEKIASMQNEEQLQELLKDFARERRQLYKIQKRFWAGQGVQAELCGRYGFTPGETDESLIEKACADSSFSAQDLRMACEALECSSTVKDGAACSQIQRWLVTPEGGRPAIYGEYSRAFLTKEGQPFSKFPSVEVSRKNPRCAEILKAEADRLAGVQERRKELECITATGGLFTLGIEIAKEYTDLKEAHAVLDYDDLVLRTLELLEGRLPKAVQWVMYKLDQGIDHILIDEAQDTNPEQWLIVKALCDEFFAGEGAREAGERTLFTVGDVKQSIYSFQRAAPEEFMRMHDYFEGKAREAGRSLLNIPLNISFRTAQKVLDLVDETFSDPGVRKGLGPEYAEHISFRAGQQGMAELWPLFESSAREEETAPWEPPVSEKNSRSGSSLLAAHIAARIREWIDGKEFLPSRERAVEAGDILILVRTRNAFVGQMMRELKLAGVPVSGLDRMVLKDQLAVEDMLAMVQFVLLPEDDLNLAAVLKSPLVGFDEDRLYRAAEGRNGSLWQSLNSPEFAKEHDYLQSLIGLAGEDRPFEFVSRLLQSPCPADPQGSGLRAMRSRLGDEVIDPLEELLEDALDYDRNCVPSLQGFLQEQQMSGREIKREQEEAGSKVRIMTVHGAKGLQAPIVIMPDTVRVNQGKVSRMLWPDKSGLDLPLWSPRSDGEPAFFRKLFDKVRERQDEEYSRLLYVAMTRAEDRLYIGGAKGRREPDGKSWYFSVKGAFERLAGKICDESGIIRIEGEQTRPADKAGKGADSGGIVAAPDEWVFRQAPEEPDPPRPLAPSRPSGDQGPVLSPLDGRSDECRFIRGNVTHRLLQFLPEIEPSRRRAAAMAFVRQPGHGLSEAVQEGVVRETMAILEDNRFARLFAPGSMAEVPVTGLLASGRVVSGQIDRMVVGDSEVLVIDYKTNRPSPVDERGIPDVYRMQMKAYKDLLQQIYPGKKIRCFLLWTDVPVLMEMEESAFITGCGT